MKLLIPLALLIAVAITVIEGDFSGDTTLLLIVIGVIVLLGLFYYWRMDKYYAALYTDKIEVQNFFRKHVFPFEGLASVGDVITTQVSGGNPIWIRSFTLNYQDGKSRKVKIAGLHYKNGKHFLDTFLAYLQQVSQQMQAAQA